MLNSVFMKEGTACQFVFSLKKLNHWFFSLNIFSAIIMVLQKKCIFTFKSHPFFIKYLTKIINMGFVELGFIIIWSWSLGMVVKKTFEKTPFTQTVVNGLKKTFEDQRKKNSFD